MRPDTLPADQATHLAQQHYDALRVGVIATAEWLLRRKGCELAHLDIDQAYNEAWIALTEAVEDGKAPAAFVASDAPPKQLRSWLVTVTFRRAIDFIRASHPERYVELAKADAHAGQPLTARVESRETLEQVLEVLTHRFSGRDARILVLLRFLGVPRREVAERFGLSPKRLNKVLDGNKGKAGLLEQMDVYVTLISTGQWCDEQASLLAAFRLGWFAPGSPKDLAARAHLKRCSRCRADA